MRELVIKPSSASHLNLFQLRDEYRACAEAGAIIGIKGTLTPKESESDQYWFTKTRNLHHHWFSSQSHAHILDLILRLEISGSSHIARVRRKSKSTGIEH